MAKYRCRACGQEGESLYEPERYACPRCGSLDVQFALGAEELPDEFFEALNPPKRAPKKAKTRADRAVVGNVGFAR
jgi:anaerobic ribonucleoside-triphosphate reductase